MKNNNVRLTVTFNKEGEEDKEVTAETDRILSYDSVYFIMVGSQLFEQTRFIDSISLFYCRRQSFQRPESFMPEERNV